jgi:hypothetical protein
MAEKHRSKTLDLLPGLYTAIGNDGCRIRFRVFRAGNRKKISVYGTLRFKPPASKQPLTKRRNQSESR